MIHPQKLNILLLMGGLAFPNLALSAERRGGSDTGGGGVIQCLSPSKGNRVTVDDEGNRHLVRGDISLALKHQRKFQFLDLFMAEHGIGPFEDKPRLFLPPDPQMTVEAYLGKALSKLRKIHPQLAAKVQEYIAANKPRMKPIPQNAYVPFPPDARLLYLPIGCSGIGFGIFDDRRNILYFDPILREELPNMDNAAFEFHEAAYKYFRDTFKHTTSWDAQRITGLAFSEYDFNLEDLVDDMEELK